MNNKIQTLENFNKIDKQCLSYPTSIIYTNIRSLRLNFSSFIVSIDKIISRVKFIVLVETNISDSETSLYNIKGFSATFFNREGRGGGIVVYVRENIPFTQISLNTKTFELLRLDVKTNNKTITLLALYRPPNQKINDFVNELEKEINNINKKQECILVGDVNIDILKQNKSTTTYLDMMLANGMQSMIKENTREDINKNTFSCIDHVFIKNKQTNAHTYAVIITTTISDHYTLFFSKDNEENNQSSANIGTREHIKILNNKKINNKIKETNWSEMIYQEENANELYRKIYLKFCEIYNKSTKLIKISKKKDLKTNG